MSLINLGQRFRFKSKRAASSDSPRASRAARAASRREARLEVERARQQMSRQRPC